MQSWRNARPTWLAHRRKEERSEMTQLESTARTDGGAGTEAIAFYFDPS